MILIHPFAKPLQNGKKNPKNYPYWKELIALIDDHIIQVGVDGEEQLVNDFRKNLSFPELRKLIQECNKWIAVDSFFQHLAWSVGKSGIVLWSVSNPEIYGHRENTNLLKDKVYLAQNQFLWWDYVDHNANAFVSPEIVLQHL
jgi:ADP-heptose:LPS heptosyltransferase